MAETSYDFIIVGGGTSGLVIANRLTEVPEVSVLVLEAGSDHSEDPRIVTPALYSSAFGTEIDWAFQTEPQAVGGSSCINAQVFAPPPKSLIDSWEALGNDEWNWSSMKPYYAKAFTAPTIDVASEAELGVDGWNGQSEASCNGPVKLSFPGNASHPIRRAWSETFKSLGHAVDDTSMLNPSTGSFSCLTSIDPVTKQRVSAAAAYYHPVSHRSNLHLMTEATVHKILCTEQPAGDGVSNAYGVEFSCKGEVKTVCCNKEVILAAGTFQSPKILELSGVGNAELLRQHGIRPIVNLPGVGENLQDHLICGISYEANDNVDTLDGLVRQEPEALGKAMEDFATAQSGWFTSIGLWGCAFMPVIGSDQQSLEKLLAQNRPPSVEGKDHRFNMVEKGLLDPKHPDGMHIFVLGQSVFPAGPAPDSPPGPVPGKFITLGTVLSHPVSTGTVHIRDSNVATAPRIDPRFLSNPVDAEVFGRNMLWLETLATSAPLSGLLKQPLQRRDPASNFGDVDAAKRLVRSSAISMWHPVGTCAMLPRGKGGVVDTELRVHGVAGLRVVDASVMPLITTSNTQSTVYAVAERVSDLIKAAYT